MKRFVKACPLGRRVEDRPAREEVMRAVHPSSILQLPAASSQPVVSSQQPVVSSQQPAIS